MSAHNGQPTAAEPVLTVPGVAILYKQNPENGARQVIGVTIAGVHYGQVAGVEILAQGPNVTRLKLETFWPFEWVLVDDKPVVAATKMPPEPPHGLRRV